MEERAVGAVGVGVCVGGGERERVRVGVWEEVREREGEGVCVWEEGRPYFTLVSLTRCLQCSSTGHSSNSCNI